MKRAASGLALLLGCASPAYDYVGPSAGSRAAAEITARYSDILRPGDALPSVALQIHELGTACVSSEALESSYRGVVNLSPQPRSISVASGDYLFIRVRFNGFEDTAAVSCTVSGGFTPAPGASYSLEFSALFSGFCQFAVQDDSGQSVAIDHPPRC